MPRYIFRNMFTRLPLRELRYLRNHVLFKNDFCFYDDMASSSHHLNSQTNYSIFIAVQPSLGICTEAVIWAYLLLQPAYILCDLIIGLLFLKSTAVRSWPHSCLQVLELGKDCYCWVAVVGGFARLPRKGIATICQMNSLQWRGNGSSLSQQGFDLTALRSYVIFLPYFQLLPGL